VAVTDPNAAIEFQTRTFSDTAGYRWVCTNDGTMQYAPASGALDAYVTRFGAPAGSVIVGPNGCVPQNLLVGGTTALGDGGVGEIALANAATVPAGNPTGGIVLYSLGGVLTYKNPQGLLQTLTGSQGGLTTTTTIANTAAETQLQGFSMPASDAIASAVYRVMGWGTYSTTGTPTIAFNVRLGGVAGTILAQIPAITTPTGAASLPFKYEIMLNFLTATTVQPVIDLDFATATADSGTVYVATPSAAVTVSLSTAKTLSTTVTWGTASASNTISLLGGYSERVA